MLPLKNVNKMADQNCDRSFALLLWQSRNRESRTIVADRERNAKRRLHCYLRRRRLVSSLFILFLTRHLLHHLPLRRVWSKPRSQFFWEETCQGWDQKDWLENFRMSKEAFNRLCNELSPHIAKRDTNYRKAIAVRHRVAITLYWLADTAHYRTIANLFGVGKSTVCCIVRQVCEVIVRLLLPRYIYLPQNRQEIQEKIECFEDRAGFPQVVGAVDGCHVPIIAPQQSPDDYVNRKGFHSLLLQGLVDCDYRFLDICVGWPGKVHDARVFKNSPLFALCCARTFLPINMSQMVSGVRVPPLILGDSAYALSDWMMKPFTDRGNVSREEANFNVRHSTTRVVVENAFGRLKGRFRSIGKRLDLNVENSCNVIAACCVLHNYCEALHEIFDDQWLNGIQLHVGVCPGDPDQRQNRNAVTIRDAIKTFLM